jgi:hypothetical protein
MMKIIMEFFIGTSQKSMKNVGNKKVIASATSFSLQKKIRELNFLLSERIKG